MSRSSPSPQGDQILADYLRVFGVAGEEPKNPQVGSYLLLGELGHGGMGTVYRAYHIHLKKKVALKTLPPHRLLDAAAVVRFRREMEALGRLDNPHLVRATDAGDWQGIPFLVMDLVDGLDLGKLAAQQGPLRVADACELIRQAAVGLEALHAHGLVHRDIKPSNLMLAGSGQVKILDMGLALLFQGQLGERLTPTGQGMGTADYMAPEQGLNPHRVDIRSDLYSLGCTLFKLLTGQVLFVGPAYDSFFKKVQAHAHVPPPRLRDLRPNVPVGLEAVLDRLLTKDPDERWATPADVTAALGPFASGHDVVRLAHPVGGDAEGNFSAAPTQSGLPSTPSAFSSVPGGPTLRPLLATPISPRASRRRSWVLVAVAGLTACLLVAAALLWRPRPEDKAGLRPSTWNILLNRPPTEISPRRRDTRWNIDLQQQEVWYQTGHLCLLALGEAGEEDFELQVGMYQPTWTGRLGIFLGYQDYLVDGKQCKKYQVIELTPYLLHKADQAFSMTRFQVILEPTEKGVSSKIKDLAGEVLPRPTGFENMLEISVSNQRLISVRWGGRVLSHLSDFTVKGAMSPNEYQGTFGLYGNLSSGTFRNARFLPREKTPTLEKTAPE